MHCAFIALFLIDRNDRPIHGRRGGRLFVVFCVLRVMASSPTKIFGDDDPGKRGGRAHTPPFVDRPTGRGVFAKCGKRDPSKGPGGRDDDDRGRGGGGNFEHPIDVRGDDEKLRKWIGPSPRPYARDATLRRGATKRPRETNDWVIRRYKPCGAFLSFFFFLWSGFLRCKAPDRRVSDVSSDRMWKVGFCLSSRTSVKGTSMRRDFVPSFSPFCRSSQEKISTSLVALQNGAHKPRDRQISPPFEIQGSAVAFSFVFLARKLSKPDEKRFGDREEGHVNGPTASPYLDGPRARPPASGPNISRRVR